jgi:hypothetical protein
VTNDLKMPRRADACAACNRTFEVGDSLQALLFDAPAGYERRDYCLACTPAEVAASALAVWKTRRPAPTERKNVPFDREAIYGFFQRIEQDDAPEKLQFRFVLALLLWRKRVLRFDRSEPGPAGETWHFSTPRGDRVHAVARPELAEEELERLSEQLEAVLAGGGTELVATTAEPGDA